MDVYVNNEPFATPADAATISDIVTAVGGGGDDDLLVTAIHLDGRRIEPEEFEEVLTSDVTSSGRLDIDVDSARKLAAQTLGEAANALEQTREYYVRIAELLAAGSTDDAMDLLNECFTIWNTAEQSLRQSSQVAGINLDAAGTLSEPPAAMVDRLGGVLTQIQQRLTSRDLVAVADVVEYDMADMTDTWQRTLVALQQQLLAN